MIDEGYANALTNRLYDICATAVLVGHDEKGKEVRTQREFGQACGTCFICEARNAYRELFVEYRKALRANPSS